MRNWYPRILWNKAESLAMRPSKLSSACSTIALALTCSQASAQQPSVVTPTGTAGESEEPLPDVNARLHWKNERGHVQLGLFGGMARFDPDVGSPRAPRWIAETSCRSSAPSVTSSG